MSRRNKDLLRILSSAVSLVVVWLITELLPVPPLVCFGLFFIVYALIGWDIVLAAIGGIGRGQILDENFLMTLATVGAFATGEHVEAVAVMLLYQIGELFQRIAVGKTRESIADLMELRPDTAHLLTQEGETDVFPEEVEIGQTIVVRPGERVPMDGVVVKGHSALDTAALTGESVPRDCHTGEEILSGVIVLNGVLEIRVEKAFYDSTVSKILDMVENASGKKARAERFITRFARYYTPVVVLLAVLLAIIPPLFDGAWKHWIQNAMNFLVVSCPCALVISVPMSFFCGIGAASREGVLVKGGDNLEQLAKADTFVFDKTGTLTRGSFAVHAVLPEEKKAEILRAAAIAERGSLHPIAKSIVLEADAIEEDWLVTEMAGYGMKAEKDGRVILAGNRKLMDLNGISVREYDLIGTSVYVAKDGVCIGVIGISDRIRPDAEETVQALKQQNVKTVMLTGDRCDVAASIVRQTGVDHCEAELLPGDKVSKVEELLASRKKDGVLAYVGDGINDAPALMRADVGIAMGGIGSDAAIEAADVVLMHDSLAAIPRARSIARKTMSIVRQNIIFALGIKLAVLALSPFGLVSIWLAIFADVGVAVLAVLNAMRSGNVKIV